MVTDLGEVYCLGTAKTEENLAFRRRLADRHTDDKPFHILAAEVERQIDCKACANCCRHSIVSVTHEEVDVIAAHLGTPVEDVARLYTDRNPDGPALRLLRSTKDGCVFLDGNLCTIYDARPKACREFPHLGPGDHSLGARPASIARWATLCPIVYNTLEMYKQLTGFHGKDAGHT